MRNFEDRMAEIKRRSGERIRARQRRNRILGLCVPLVLCLSVGVVALAGGADTLPDSLPGNTETISDVQDVTLSGQVIVSASGLYRVSDDSKTVERVEKILDVVTANAAAADHSYVSKADDTLQLTTGDPYKAGYDITYSIMIRGIDDSVKCYSLIGNELMDKSNDQIYILTQKQVSDLLKVLDFQSNGG